MTARNPRKKRLSIPLCFLFVFILTLSACNSEPAPGPTTTASPTSTVDESTTPAPSPTIPTTETPITTGPLTTWTADGIISDGEYPNSSEDGNFQLFWKNDTQYFYAGMRAKTTGYVSMALQPGDKMKNADMIFGYVIESNTTVMDLFSTGTFGPHPPDTEQGGSDDVIDYGGIEENGFTTIEFKRLLDTGDELDNVINTGTNKIIWAFGSSDNLNASHSARGYGEIIID